MSGRETYRFWSEAEVADLTARLLGGEDYPTIARALGRPVHSVKSKALQLGVNPMQLARAASPAAPPRPLAPDATDPDAATVESAPGDAIRTLEQLLAATAVDLAVWEVERYVVNKWEAGTKGPDGKPVVTPLFQVKAWLRRICSTALAALIADVTADIASDTARRAVPPVPRPARRAVPAERVMLEVVLADLHLGKYAWGEETGTDYDSEIAERLAAAALDDLLHQARGYAIDRCLFPFGNDFFHYDTPHGTTTAGTPQDRDTRVHRMYRRGRAVASACIQRLAEIAPVVVPVVPGNHAELLEFTMGVVLEAEFRHDPRVTVDNSPRPRKYVRYGRNLVMFAHGHQEPHGELPLIMATEEPALWAETRYREVHLGHLHHARTREKHSVGSHLGVKTRIIQSLTGTDAWHARKGYVGEPRAAEAFVWRFAGGLRAHLVSYPVFDADDAALESPTLAASA